MLNKFYTIQKVGAYLKNSLFIPCMVSCGQKRIYLNNFEAVKPTKSHNQLSYISILFLRCKPLLTLLIRLITSYYKTIEDYTLNKAIFSSFKRLSVNQGH